MFKLLSTSLIISTFIAVPALAGSITVDVGSVSQPGSQNAASEPTGSAGSPEVATDYMSTLVGCAAPSCTAGVTQYVSLNNSFKYSILTAIAPGGTPDNFVLPGDTQNQSSLPEPATFALLGFGALGLLALRRSRPSSSI
jgi:hypothetical protein